MTSTTTPRPLTHYRAKHTLHAHWAARFRAIADTSPDLPADHARIYRATADHLDPWASARDLLPGAPVCDEADVWQLANRALRARRVPPADAMPTFAPYRGTVLMQFVSWPNYIVSADALRWNGYRLIKAPERAGDYGTWAIAVPGRPRIASLV